MAKYTLAENIQRVKASLQERFDAGKQAMRDDFFGSKTDWSYFCYQGANTDILSKLNYEDTSNGTNFSNMFAYANKITEIPEINTSKGTGFAHMFDNCEKLVTIPNVDTSNGTTFEYMFNNCRVAKEIPQIDTSGCNSKFDSMFNNCYEITTIPQMDFSNGTSFASLFYGCTKLERLPKIKFGSGIINQAFAYCPALHTIDEIDFTETGNNSQVFKNSKALQTMNVVGTIKTTFDFSPCTLLTIESLRTIKNALEDYSNETLSWTPKLTIGSANIAKFSAEELEEITQKGWLYQ